MVSPIDPQTLAAIGGQQASQASRGFLESMLALSQNKRQQEEASQLGQLRQLQMQQTQQDMARQELQTKLAMGEAVIKENARRAKLPTAKSRPEDWSAWAQKQDVAGNAQSAQFGFGMAKALASGQEIPADLLKNQRPAFKALFNMDQAARRGDQVAFQAHQQDLKNILQPATKEQKPKKVEGSRATAVNIASQLDLTGIDIDGETAQSLGDLSRSLVERNTDLTQSEINDKIVLAYETLRNQKREAASQGWFGFAWQADDPTKAEVEQHVLEQIKAEQAYSQGRGAEPLMPTQEDALEDVMNQYRGAR